MCCERVRLRSLALDTLQPPVLMDTKKCLDILLYCYYCTVSTMLHVHSCTDYGTLASATVPSVKLTIFHVLKNSTHSLFIHIHLSCYHHTYHYRRPVWPLAPCSPSSGLPSPLRLPRGWVRRGRGQPPLSWRLAAAGRGREAGTWQ